MRTLPKTRRCVIADDLRASRLMIQVWIESCGYSCEAAANGTDAWDAVVRTKPNLIVTDIEMPCGSGLDLLCSLRNHRSREIRNIPVIVISSLLDDEIRQFVHDAGGTFYLPKPLDKSSLLRVVNHLDDLTSVFAPFDTIGAQHPHDGATQISPTLRRLYHDIQVNGPRFH